MLLLLLAGMMTATHTLTAPERRGEAAAGAPTTPIAVLLSPPPLHVLSNVPSPPAMVLAGAADFVAEPAIRGEGGRSRSAVGMAAAEAATGETLLHMSTPAFSVGPAFDRPRIARRLADVEPGTDTLQAALNAASPGTLVEPGAGTLQAAHDAASAGDELVLKDGKYTGSGHNVLEISKDSIALRAQNQGRAIIDGENARRAIHITSGTAVVDGLVITRTNATV